MKTIPHQGLFASFRVCPNCGGYFAPDTDTKIRQVFFILVALISLVFTCFLYFELGDWLDPAISSYVALGLLIYWGNKKIYLVPYTKKRPTSTDA